MSDACYVGLDVAKATLEVAWSTDPAARWHTTNDDAGGTALIAHVGRLQPRLIVLEATGGYELGIASALSAAGLPVAIVNPRHVRAFARAMGVLEKTDRIDAGVGNRSRSRRGSGEGVSCRQRGGGGGARV